MTGPLAEPTVATADEFRIYLRGFDDGAANVWRTLAELVRADIPDESLRYVIEQTAARAVPSARDIRTRELPPGSVAPGR